MFFDIRDDLYKIAEPEYQLFSSKLLPGVDNILGVRLPKLRKLAKQVEKEYGAAYLDAALEKLQDENTAADDRENFHGEYMEEVLLQGMVIGNLKVQTENSSHRKTAVYSLEQIQDYIRKYIPKIDNWSTCDSFCAGLKIAKEYPEPMWEFIQEYLVSDRDYDVRFGIVMIINYFIQDANLDKIFEIFNRIGENKDVSCYYVEMALAWAISICYVKYPDQTFIYLEKMRNEETILNDFTYHKALQKIVESHCVTQEKKAEIKLMKRTK